MFATATDGTRLYYEESGAGEPLLLVSGQCNDHHQWDGVRGTFADSYRTIVYDHRGTGRSDKPDAPPYSTRGFAADAVAVLDAVGAGRAHVYGISMGGRIAQWIGIDHPERLGALVLGATTPGDRHGVARPAHATKVLTALPSRVDRQALMELMYTPAWIEAHPEVLVPQPDSMPGHARRMHYAASQGHDTWELLPRIAAPTLVVHGADDELNPVANADLLADRIPGAQRYLVDRGRHGYQDEFVQEAGAVVREFLGRHPL
ncbi:alpha/beta hydrolase [Amycolatopsis antarctica]|uniref:Alpha/beta hydrolase n=1 Tax=Amycolatopsis antarctica TaxID=1854586 RepID=A0A263D4Y6_9PSEU|nr:alpha/beta fold hydrolase [Amycolatopsis antarctica]OZM72667.1 alpha/beta hydrolase [Amycolatopsis antarctica]